jgi:hypothetical protein
MTEIRNCEVEVTPWPLNVGPEMTQGSRPSTVLQTPCKNALLFCFAGDN